MAIAIGIGLAITGMLLGQPWLATLGSTLTVGALVVSSSGRGRRRQ